MKVSVQDISALSLLANPCVGAENLSAALTRVVHLAMKKGAMEDSKTKILTIFHDSFRDTPANKVRMSACITKSKVLEAPFLDAITVNAATCIKGDFEIGIHEFSSSWASLYGWMNANGFRPTGQDPFEIYHNDYQSHPEKKCIVSMYIPIVK
jgi:AraC family transcriptional regulator